MKFTLAGLLVGLCLGWTVTLAAQTLNIKIDAANAVCWDQPAASLAAANSIKARVTYDTGTATAVGLTCSGTASPFACNLTTAIPMSVQTAGVTHTVKVEGANPNPDGTYGAYSTLITGSLTFWTDAAPPSPGSNFRIIKLLQAIAHALSSFWHWLT